jgi:hypothetical protein
MSVEGSNPEIVIATNYRKRNGDQFSQGQLTIQFEDIVDVEAFIKDVSEACNRWA